MGLFWKKEKQTEVPQQETVPTADISQAEAAVTTEYTETHESDSKKCYRQLERQLRNGSQGVVLKLYIENFKRMNQLFGYDYCEELLEHILKYLEQEMGCTVYRYVGVEYIAVLSGYTQGQALRLAERVIERFNHGWEIRGTNCLCFVQIGLCSYPGYAMNVSEMLKCLDLAVSKAAEVGSNEYVLYDMKLHMQFLRRQTIAQYISRAIDQNEIEVRYRPTYDTKTGRFTRAEFYMSMFVKDIGMVGSAEFLPIAEDTGQIRSVEYYALDRVAATIAKLLKAGTEFESISIPISPVLLLQEDFLEELKYIIGEHEIPAGKLAIEIDEYAMSIASVSITVLMQELAELGVELILNNFGSGYSGISTILELPVNTLKFDRMFIWQLETNPQAEPIIEGLVQIADRMGKKLIAEGVETERQLDALNRFGCAYQQGFYYASALTEDVLLKIMDTSLEASAAILQREKEKLGR